VEGFRKVYVLLAARRRDLLAPDGPIAPFGAVPIRAVLRSTRAYGLLLEEGFHPDFLRDALDRDRFFDRLWVGVEEFPAIERIVRAEHEELWRGDVPYFEARPDGTDLLAGTGERIEKFFPEDSLDEARRRIEGMGDEDLFRQAWLTRISLGTLLLNRSQGDWPGFVLEEPAEAPGETELRTRLVRAARAVGDWFERMAVRDREHLTWVGLDLRNQIWSLYPMPEDLYSGTPGIALFLGYLAAHTGEERYAEMARCGMRTLQARLRRVADEIPNIGMFQGWGGVVYSLAHLGVLWRDPEVLAEAEAMAERIAARVAKDTYLDVVAGSAGALSALLALHHASGSRRALEVAAMCGERLLETAKPTGPGLSWRTEIGGDEPLTGFSHGAAGIAMTLLELSAVTGDERLKTVARAAFDFERESVRAEAKGRETQAEPGSSHGPTAEKAMAMSWCYGAPGRGLACLRALRHLDDLMLREDLERSVAATLERGFGKNHSLCHGDLGNLDLILQAHRDLRDEKAGAEARRLTRGILNSVERDGWICGTVANIEAPGLMNGIAGIGYGLLRAADPSRIPSVLVMERPPAGAAG
jgi:type 2 lantibiotic biosynthesis protein LanM